MKPGDKVIFKEESVGDVVADLMSEEFDGDISPRVASLLIEAVETGKPLILDHKEDYGWVLTFSGHFIYGLHEESELKPYETSL